MVLSPTHAKQKPATSPHPAIRTPPKTHTAQETSPRSSLHTDYYDSTATQENPFTQNPTSFRHSPPSGCHTAHTWRPLTNNDNKNNKQKTQAGDPSPLTAPEPLARPDRTNFVCFPPRLPNRDRLPTSPPPPLYSPTPPPKKSRGEAGRRKTHLLPPPTPREREIRTPPRGTKDSHLSRGLVLRTFMLTNTHTRTRSRVTQICTRENSREQRARGLRNSGRKRFLFFANSRT